MAIFSKPDVVSAYVERLDATTLPFAIDAAHILELVPPNQGTEYVILDDACGTGAAVEWIVRAFAKADVPLQITATDQSAVMMNEVDKRRQRNSWSDDVRFVMMDAQVQFPHALKLIIGIEFSIQYLYACIHDIWDHVGSGL
jgi:ubiquinone/menaquinone biosynthesis C-methylase UbiE